MKEREFVSFCASLPCPPNCTAASLDHPAAFLHFPESCSLFVLVCNVQPFLYGHQEKSIKIYHLDLFNSTVNS
jgi:hypothetical protein